CWFFIFQAEDGIRDWSVTGVQTCALPIYDRGDADRHKLTDFVEDELGAELMATRHRRDLTSDAAALADEERGHQVVGRQPRFARSEERRVGKEGRSPRRRTRWIEKGARTN